MRWRPPPPFVVPLATTSNVSSANSWREFRTYAETEQLPTMDDLDRVIGAPDPMPPGVDVQPLGRREYGFLAPGRNGLEQGDERPCIQ